MNVNATDKANGKSNKITITNNKGRLSKEDIERFVKEAEQFKNEDEQLRKKVDAKNALENYLYSVRNTLRDDKWKDKITEDEKKTVTSKLDTLTSWFESNKETASVEELESK
jgi:heat shock 70kDa protein 1/2/6/8